MKTYIKPSIEVVEAKLSANYLLDMSDTYTSDPAYSPRKKGNYIPEEEEEEEYDNNGW